MFYALSKLLAFLLQPAMWIIFCLIAALLTKKSRRRKRALWMGLLLFFCFGNPWLINSAYKSMEPENLDLSGKKFDYAIVLGGFGEHSERTSGIELHRSADRLTEGMRLYNMGIVERLIISSGVTEGDSEVTEAQSSRDFLLENGIPAQDIFTENKSWNTIQNATYTRQLIDSIGISGNGLLITSATHMKRAMACFEAQNFKLTPYHTDYQSTTGTMEIQHFLWPSMHSVVDWDVIIKELVGRQVYWMKGYK